MLCFGVFMFYLLFWFCILFWGSSPTGFRSVNPDVVVTYTGTGSGAGRNAVSGATQPPSDFAGSNVVFTEGDVATSRKLQRAAPWALIASTSAVVVAYTLPEKGLESKQLGTLSSVSSTATVANFTETHFPMGSALFRVYCSD